MRDGKIVKSKVFMLASFFNEENFFDLTTQACRAFDVPTPIILSTHIFYYTEFNHCVFLPRDFVEKFPFDKLVLENAV